jgi:hypothetical protein
MKNEEGGTMGILMEGTVDFGGDHRLPLLIKADGGGGDGFRIEFGRLRFEAKFATGKEITEIWLTREAYSDLARLFASRNFGISLNGTTRSFQIKGSECCEMEIWSDEGRLAAKVYVDGQIPLEAVFPEELRGLILN